MCPQWAVHSVQPIVFNFAERRICTILTTKLVHIARVVLFGTTLRCFYSRALQLLPFDNK